MLSSDLESVFRKPNLERQLAWEHLTKGNRLFCDLQLAIKEHVISNVREWVAPWGTFVKEANNKETEHKWHIIRTMVWCAEQAANHPDHHPNDLDAAVSNLPKTTGAPEFIKELLKKGEEWEAWVKICFRSFLGISAYPYRVEVPVVGWDQKQNNGMQETSILEVLDNGSGQLAHHPQDVFCTHIDEEFRSSMHDAWKAARELVKNEHGELPLLDGRWRLLKGWTPNALERTDLPPAEEANDRSASGAAAWGWYFALQQKIPDERVIVLAQVDTEHVEEGVLKPVDGIGAKVKTIAEDRYFDTIAVVSGNFQKAQEALKTWDKTGEIRVKLIEDI